MLETEPEIAALQELLDRSYAAAGGLHLEIMTPERRLDASKVVRHLEGIRHVALATVNSRGEPRVSPLDGPVPARTLPRQHERTRAEDSASDGESRGQRRLLRRGRDRGDGNGSAVLLRHADSGTEDYDRVATDIYGSSRFSWGSDIVVIRVEPERMYAYAPHPEQFPE